MTLSGPGLRWLPLMLLSTLLWCAPAGALQVPRHTGPVIDLAGVLNPADQTRLAASLVQFQQQHGPQLQLLVIPRLEDETIESYSIKVVENWQLGSEDKDDGVLLLVAKEDRKMRIEVGQGLEGDLTDVLAGRIIRAGIAPFFQQGQFGEGIVMGMRMIAESVGGTLENVPISQTRKPRQSSGSGLGFILFLIFFLIGPALSGRRRGGVGSALMAGMLLGGSSRRYGGGGFGGGGFGGGGGGFSGGGASGGW